MKPINFKQSTKVLQKPGTLSDSECGTLEAINQGKNQHLVRRQGVVGRNVRKDTTARFCSRGTCFSENAVFSPFEGVFYFSW